MGPFLRVRPFTETKRARGLMRMVLVAVLAVAMGGCGQGERAAGAIEPAASSQPPDGARLFQRRCAVCHGVTGEGQEMALGARSANLTEAALQARLTDAELVRIMQSGTGRMPAVTGLRADEAKAIAAHVRSIRKP